MKSMLLIIITVFVFFIAEDVVENQKQIAEINVTLQEVQRSLEALIATVDTLVQRQEEMYERYSVHMLGHGVRVEPMEVLVD